MYEYGELSEAKDAKSLPEYDGKVKGELWRKNVSYYLISKYPDMEKPLEWVESKKGVVDSKILKTYERIPPQDPIALAKHLCGFFNISLT